MSLRALFALLGAVEQEWQLEVDCVLPSLYRIVHAAAPWRRVHRAACPRPLLSCGPLAYIRPPLRSVVVGVWSGLGTCLAASVKGGALHGFRAIIQVGRLSDVGAGCSSLCACSTKVFAETMQHIQELSEPNAHACWVRVPLVHVRLGEP